MTTTVVHAATTVEALIRDDEAKAMDVDEPHVDSVSEEIILATYRKDAVTVAECLKRCTPETTAEMSLSRAAAVQLLGEDVYLGSHSWSTQEGFPVMYFAGANPGFRRRAVHAPAPPSRGAGRETCRVFVFSRERNRLLPSHRASNRWGRPLSRPDETYRAGSYPNEHATVAPTTRYPEDGPSRRCDTPSRAPPRGPAPRPPREKTPHMVFSRGSWNPAWTRYFATSKFRGRSSLRSPTPVGGASDDAPRPLPPSFSRPARFPSSLTDPSLSASLSPSSAKWGGADVTRVLLEAGAKVAQSTTLGVQPLHMAAQEGHVDVARLLVAHGAPCGATDRAGWSAFHYAANHRWATWRGPIDGQLAVLQLLAERGADVDAADGEGYTCAHSAAQSGKAEIIRLLRRLGARPDATTVRGVMPIHVAAEGGRAEVVDELLRWRPDLAETPDFRGHRPMHHAAYHGHADVVEVLLRHGARACPGGGTERERAEEGSETGRRGDTTPLHLAARSNALDAVMVLLAGGADPRAVDASGWTPRALAEECASRGRSDRAAHAAVDAALRVAEGGAPLRWNRRAHASYPREFRVEMHDVVRAMAAATRPVRGLAADTIVDEVIRERARSAWPEEVRPETWAAVDRIVDREEARRTTKTVAARTTRAATTTASRGGSMDDATASGSSGASSRARSGKRAAEHPPGDDDDVDGEGEGEGEVTSVAAAMSSAAFAEGVAAAAAEFVAAYQRQAHLARSLAAA